MKTVADKQPPTQFAESGDRDSGQLERACTVFVASLEEVKDRVSELEHLFCSNLYPALRDELSRVRRKSQREEKAHDESRMEWEQRRQAFVQQAEQLRVDHEAERSRLVEECRSVREAAELQRQELLTARDAEVCKKEEERKGLTGEILRLQAEAETERAQLIEALERERRSTQVAQREGKNLRKLYNELEKNYRAILQQCVVETKVASGSRGRQKVSQRSASFLDGEDGPWLAKKQKSGMERNYRQAQVDGLFFRAKGKGAEGRQTANGLGNALGIDGRERVLEGLANHSTGGLGDGDSAASLQEDESKKLPWYTVATSGLNQAQYGEQHREQLRPELMKMGILDKRVVSTVAGEQGMVDDMGESRGTDEKVQSTLSKENLEQPRGAWRAREDCGQEFERATAKASPVSEDQREGRDRNGAGMADAGSGHRLFSHRSPSRQFGPHGLQEKDLNWEGGGIRERKSATCEESASTINAPSNSQNHPASSLASTAPETTDTKVDSTIAKHALVAEGTQNNPAISKPPQLIAGEDRASHSSDPLAADSEQNPAFSQPHAFVPAISPASAVPSVACLPHQIMPSEMPPRSAARKPGDLATPPASTLASKELISTAGGKSLPTASFEESTHFKVPASKNPRVLGGKFEQDKPWRTTRVSREYQEVDEADPHDDFLSTPREMAIAAMAARQTLAQVSSQEAVMASHENTDPSNRIQPLSGSRDRPMTLGVKAGWKRCVLGESEDAMQSLETLCPAPERTSSTQEDPRLRSPGVREQGGETSSEDGCVHFLDSRAADKPDRPEPSNPAMDGMCIEKSRPRVAQGGTFRAQAALELGDDAYARVQADGPPVCSRELESDAAAYGQGNAPSSGPMVPGEQQRLAPPQSKAPAPAFKYNEPVRKKADREALQGIECKTCKQFYDAVLAEDADGIMDNRCEHHQAASRHRYRYAPPATPDGFWNIGFDTE